MRLFIGFDLLDRQIVDRDGMPVGNVDDVELAVDGDGTMRIVALLVGQQAWGRRLGGVLGQTITGAAVRLQKRRPPGPLRIPLDMVTEHAAAVKLSVTRDMLADPELETWLRRHVIGRIPGAHDASA